MKKHFILLGVLAMGLAYSQTGKVGINTNSPEATLDIRPNAANSVVGATTNEGMLVPRLSKARLNLHWCMCLIFQELLHLLQLM